MSLGENQRFGERQLLVYREQDPTIELDNRHLRSVSIISKVLVYKVNYLL